jgi:hypothetical protein
MIAGCEKVLAMTSPEVKFIPGHGPMSSPAGLRKFVDMLKSTRSLVAQALKDGKTVDQMKKDNLLEKYEEDYGNGFIKADVWIDVLYADLQPKPVSGDAK